MEEIAKIQHKLPSQEIDYYKIARILFSRWYWVVGSVLTCMVIASCYLWYTPKLYATYSTIKFEEKKSEISDIIGAGGGGERGPVSRIQSETIVLQSSALLLSAIRQLDYRVSFFVVGRVLNRTSDLYPAKPLSLEFVRFDSLNFFRGLITFRPVSRSSFSISYLNSGKKITENHHYGVPFTIGSTSFSIKYPGELSGSSSFLFKINSPEDFIGRVRGGLHIAETAKNSNIISMQETDANPQFAADILNAIMKEYLIYDRNQRTQSASQMIHFIDTQLDFLANEVKGSENSIASYKKDKNLLDASSSLAITVDKAKDLESQKSILNIELLAINDLKKEIIKGKENLNLNFSVEGVTSPQIEEDLKSLNSLINSKNVLLKTFVNNSQPVEDANQQILQIKSNILGNLESMSTLVSSKIKYLNDQLTPINNQIAQMPENERDMAGLRRDFEINDKVYSFLSEKKLDEQISSAGILPGATIIDVAQPNFGPVSPDENGIRRSAIIFGFVIGLGAIFLIRILNPFIYDKETIESLTSIPIIGIIRKFPEEIDEFSSQILAISKPKSIFAESVRSVRTNLSFIASEKNVKVICITSEVAGEGKSFVAVNLSSTMALIDKKVILIGADLRRSKLHKTFQVSNDIGLSSYLANQCELSDVIKKSSQGNLDFILSGPVPPNPSELLHSSRMHQLISELKEIYDVIMIDTAPIGLVSDAIPLIRNSDVNLFVIRSGKSKFYAATVPERIAQEYHLDNNVIVLNAFEQDLLHSRYYTTKFTGDSYGAKYYYYSDYTGYESSGYYIDTEENKWWNIRRWFKK